MADLRVSFEALKARLAEKLLKEGFSPERAEMCAQIFASNSLDDVASHGANRFPVFIEYVRRGMIDIHAEPALVERFGHCEVWDGHLGVGMYNATKAMEKAVILAREHGIGLVVLKNTNHWMRGGTYGWQAANAGCIGICWSNTIANMPAWGGMDPRIGNNPLVIAVPRHEGHVVLDMAMSQFSYGQLQQHVLDNKKLPVAGGYDENGQLTNDAEKIRASRRVLPIGYWKGSGLSILLDVLLVALGGGNSTFRITQQGEEKAVSQCFIAICRPSLHTTVVEEILQYNAGSVRLESGRPVQYPGEGTLRARTENLVAGIPVNQEIWDKIEKL
jgi:3-dehydro-L-gulonate 2-dehydrogenase